MPATQGNSNPEDYSTSKRLIELSYTHREKSGWLCNNLPQWHFIKIVKEFLHITPRVMLVLASLNAAKVYIIFS